MQYLNLTEIGTLLKSTYRVSLPCIAGGAGQNSLFCQKYTGIVRSNLRLLCDFYASFEPPGRIIIIPSGEHHDFNPKRPPRYLNQKGTFAQYCMLAPVTTPVRHNRWSLKNLHLKSPNKAATMSLRAGRLPPPNNDR